MADIREMLEQNEKYARVLPPSALARFMALLQLAEDKFAATRELSSKRGELQERAAHVRSELVRLDSQKFVVGIEERGRAFQNPADLSRKELALLDAELVKLKASYPSRAEAAQNAGALIDNVRQFIELLRGMAAPFKGSAELKQLPKGEAPRDVLDRLRKRVAELDADRRAAESAPVPAAEAKAAAREQIAYLAASGAPQCFDLIQYKGGRVAWPDLVTQSVAGPSTHPDALAILAHAAPELLIAAVDKQIDSLCDDANCLDHASRTKLLKKIRDEKLHTERQEEQLIERLEGDGIQVARRPDASPLAILGLADVPSAVLAGIEAAA